MVEVRPRVRLAAVGGHPIAVGEPHRANECINRHVNRRLRGHIGDRVRLSIDRRRIDHVSRRHVHRPRIDRDIKPGNIRRVAPAVHRRKALRVDADLPRGARG